jgi:hypothetical protein
MGERMNWTRAKDGEGYPVNAIKSGVFTISKAKVMGIDKYVLWHGDAPVNSKDSADECKEAASALHAAGAR